MKKFHERKYEKTLENNAVVHAKLRCVWVASFRIANFWQKKFDKNILSTASDAEKHVELNGEIHVWILQKWRSFTKFW